MWHPSNNTNCGQQITHPTNKQLSKYKSFSYAIEINSHSIIRIYLFVPNRSLIVTLIRHLSTEWECAQLCYEYVPVLRQCYGTARCSEGGPAFPAYLRNRARRASGHLSRSVKPQRISAACRFSVARESIRVSLHLHSLACTDARIQRVGHVKGIWRKVSTV